MPTASTFGLPAQTQLPDPRQLNAQGAYNAYNTYPTTPSAGSGARFIAGGVNAPVGYNPTAGGQPLYTGPIQSTPPTSVPNIRSTLQTYAQGLMTPPPAQPVTSGNYTGIQNGTPSDPNNMQPLTNAGVTESPQDFAARQAAVQEQQAAKAQQAYYTQLQHQGPPQTTANPYLGLPASQRAGMTTPLPTMSTGGAGPVATPSTPPPVPLIPTPGSPSAPDQSGNSDFTTQYPTGTDIQQQGMQAIAPLMQQLLKSYQFNQGLYGQGTALLNQQQGNVNAFQQTALGQAGTVQQNAVDLAKQTMDTNLAIQDEAYKRLQRDEDLDYQHQDDMAQRQIDYQTLQNTVQQANMRTQLGSRFGAFSSTAGMQSLAMAQNEGNVILQQMNADRLYAGSQHLNKIDDITNNYLLNTRQILDQHDAQVTAAKAQFMQTALGIDSKTLDSTNTITDKAASMMEEFGKTLDGIAQTAASAVSDANTNAQSRMDNVRKEMRSDYFNQIQVNHMFMVLPQDTMTFEQSTQKALQSDPLIQPFLEAQPMFTQLDTAYQRASTANNTASDQVLIQAFNRLANPSMGVRDYEYVRTGENQPLWDKVQGYIQQIQTGGTALDDQGRKDVYTMAQKLETAYNEKAAEAIQPYTMQLLSFNQNPNVVKQADPRNVFPPTLMQFVRVSPTNLNQFDSIINGTAPATGGPAPSAPPVSTPRRAPAPPPAPAPKMQTAVGGEGQTLAVGGMGSLTPSIGPMKVLGAFKNAKTGETLYPTAKSDLAFYQSRPSEFIDLNAPQSATKTSQIAGGKTINLLSQR